MKYRNIIACTCLIAAILIMTAACTEVYLPKDAHPSHDTAEIGSQNKYSKTENELADTADDFPVQSDTNEQSARPDTNTHGQTAEHHSFNYVLCAKIFASDTQLYFSPIDANDRILYVYHTEDHGKSMNRTEYVIPEEYVFDKAEVICCGYGAGSGECQFLIKLTFEDSIEYLAYNNFTWGVDQSYLEFRCVGILSHEDAENYYSDAKYKTDGVKFDSGPTVSNGLDIPTAEELEAQGVSYASGTYEAISALLRGDIDSFASACYVEPEVYDDMRSMKIGKYRFYVDILPVASNSDRTHACPVLELEVIESNSDFFTPGIHSLVFEEGLVVTFTPLDSYAASRSGELATPAKKYISQIGYEDFSVLSSEGRMQFGLCDFIVARLDTLAGNDEPRTEEEIRAYAEKYLGVDGDTLNIEKSLEKVDGGYIRIGRCGGTKTSTFLSEEIRDEVTVVTVQYWADYSKTVPSRTVEYHMEFLDGEYRPVKSVVIRDSDYKTAYIST